MEDLFARIVIGHLIGDYLLQNKKMALCKSSGGVKGELYCLSHCFLYTAAVCLFLYTADPLIWLLVFLSHWPIDRFSLAGMWLRMIRGRDIIVAFESRDKYREIDLSFSCLVYATADNTMHIILLWLITKII